MKRLRRKFRRRSRCKAIKLKYSFAIATYNRYGYWILSPHDFMNAQRAGWNPLPKLPIYLKSWSLK